MTRSGSLWSRCGRLALLALAAALFAGCHGGRARPNLVWGKRGVQGGDLVKPRAIAIDASDRLYLVDWTARIQAFDRDGHFLGKCWTTPDYRNGRPSGLSIDNQGNLIVSDSHYHCIRTYSPDGELLRTFGGTKGDGPGELGYVADTIVDADGYYYVAEFYDTHRISKFTPDGKFIKSWGAPGSEPGQFARSARWRWGPTATSTSPMRATTASRSSRATASWCASGARPAADRANCRIRTIWRSDAVRRRAYTWWSSATIACRSSRRRANRSAPGADQGTGQGNCKRRGRWRSIATGKCMWSIAITIGFSGLIFDFLFPLAA